MCYCTKYYKKCIKYIDTNTFVYFDPPYRPLNITSGFTSYTKENFDDENQKELALYYKELNNNNVQGEYYLTDVIGILKDKKEKVEKKK